MQTNQEYRLQRNLCTSKSATNTQNHTCSRLQKELGMPADECGYSILKPKNRLRKCPNGTAETQLPQKSFGIQSRKHLNCSPKESFLWPKTNTKAIVYRN